MKVDAIGVALYNMYSRLMKQRIDEVYGAYEHKQRLTVVRGMLAACTGAVAFKDYCQRNLVGECGDTMCSMLDELWGELGMPDGTVWEQFEAQYLTAVEDEQWIEP